MPKLKVFCATSGFYDQIVAVPSKPAALKAWGAKTDLFSMGVAHRVSDPAMEKAALARPGEVIRRKRTADGEKSEAIKRKPSKRPKPPSRARLAAAEERLARLRTQQEEEMAALDREMRALDAKRARTEKAHSNALRQAEQKVEDAKQNYQSALNTWSE